MTHRVTAVAVRNVPSRNIHSAVTSDGMSYPVRPQCSTFMPGSTSKGSAF